MLAQEKPFAESESPSVPTIDLGGANMIISRLSVAVSLLLDKNDLGSEWKDFASEVIELTKLEPSGETFCDFGTNRISHRRNVACYTLEDTYKGTCRVLRYGEDSAPELVLERDISPDGVCTWKVVYSIGGKYPLPGETMQRRTDS